MKEGDQERQPEFTEIPITFNGEILKTILVPFSGDEVTRLNEAAALQERLFPSMERSSGPIREFYFGNRVPRGARLLNREAAIEKIGEVVSVADEILAGNSRLTPDDRSCLEGIKTSLLPFLPPPQIENTPKKT